MQMCGPCMMLDLDHPGLPSQALSYTGDARGVEREEGRGLNLAIPA
jgi:hypothetical protein